MMSLAPMTPSVKWRKDPPPFLIGKATRTAENIRMERSSLLSREMADRACDALNRLPSVVTGTARVVRDHMTTLERNGEARFYVRWIRKSGEKLTPDMQKLQFTRAERAARQFHEMAFFPCLEEPDATWCVHYTPDREEAGVYLLRPDLSTCTCPDWEYRHQQTGDICKHLEAQAIAAGEQRRQQHRRFPDTPEGRAALDAHCRQMREIDW
jgi:hypothetical protein